MTVATKEGRFGFIHSVARFFFSTRLVFFRRMSFFFLTRGDRKRVDTNGGDKVADVEGIGSSEATVNSSTATAFISRFSLAFSTLLLLLLFRDLRRLRFSRVLGGEDGAFSPRSMRSNRSVDSGAASFFKTTWSI